MSSINQMLTREKIAGMLGAIIFMILLCKVNVNRKILIGLGIFHATTFFVVLTCQYQNWYYSSMTYVKEGMFPYIETKDGPWHHVYSFILLFYIVFGLYKLIQAVRKEQYELERKRLTYFKRRSIIWLCWHLQTSCPWLSS